jgi:hypothetical protein
MITVALYHRWKKRELTYTFTGERSYWNPDGNDYARQVQEACNIWSQHSGLNFKRGAFDDQRADFALKWVKAIDMPHNATTDHGRARFPGSDDSDRRPFIFFNNDASWNASWTFFHTALHEIGHVIGLEHSDDDYAVMYPIAGRSRALSTVDICAAVP